MLKGKKAILFDMDGTLIDSMNVWRDIDEVYLKRYHMVMPDGLQDDIAGLSITATADYFREKLGIMEPVEKMISDWNELAMYYYECKIPMKPGAMEFLEFLKQHDIPCAVGTSNTRHLTETILKVHKITDMFDVVLNGEDIVNGKPAPDIYLEAARRLHTAPAQCLVFEDIPEGIIAGKAAGMEVCAVYDSFSEKSDAIKRQLSDYYIHSFNEIREVKEACAYE